MSIKIILGLIENSIDFIDSFNLFVKISFELFAVASSGLLFTRKNVILMLLSIEIILISITLLFYIFSINLDDMFGFIVTIYILTIAAAESAIGLALIVVVYRLRGLLIITELNKIKGG